jgi:fused signal recognition particle receptor
MFDFLKKKLSESVDRLAEKIREKQEAPAEAKKEQPKPEPKAEKKTEHKHEKAAVSKPEKKIEKKAEKVVSKPVKKAETKPEINSETKHWIVEANGRGDLSVRPEPKVEKVEPKIEAKPEPKTGQKKPGFFGRIIPGRKEEKPKEQTVKKQPFSGAGTGMKHFGKGLGEMVLEKKMSEKDIDDFFSEIELDLMEANVALEVVDFLKERIKQHLVNKQFKRGKVKDSLIKAFEDILMEIFDQGTVDLEELLKKKKPVCIVFIGFNGSGKTTSIAKLTRYLQDRKYKVVLAAGDTFRAASIEQLENHGKRLGVKVIKHEYGADSAAVIFDAVKHAESKGIDFVLADTAGRTHQDKNLMDEIKKVVRVNKPELKVLVVDSLTGNDVIEQAQQFDKTVGIDCMIFTKVDVNQKGGSLLSACYAIKKPILFIGTGQSYDSIEIFEPKKFVKDLMGE